VLKGAFGMNMDKAAYYLRIFAPQAKKDAPLLKKYAPQIKKDSEFIISDAP
jgi:hypothetical protein